VRNTFGSVVEYRISLTVKFMTWNKPTFIGCFFSYLSDKYRSYALLNILLYFLKVIVTAVVCLSHVVNC
jgi:hypothetical protein